VGPGDAGALASDAGDVVTLGAPAPGVLRLRVGRSTLPDYGILAAGDADRPAPTTANHGVIQAQSGPAEVELASEPLRLTLRWRGRELLRPPTDQHFRGWSRLPIIGRGPEGWVVAFDLGEFEPVYGLGERFGRLDRRGQRVDCWTDDALGVNTDRAYKNVPFCWSPRGWGLFVHSPARVVFGVGYGAWSHRTLAAVVEDEALDIFLIAADTPAAILAAYTALVGRAPPTPEWGFGLWLSRAYYRSPDEAVAAAREVRRRRIPADVITFDGRAWQDTATRFHFDFDRRRFADAGATIAEIKALGFRICCWEYPLVAVDGPHFGELDANGWLLKRRDGSTYVHAWDLNPRTTPFGQVLSPLPPSGIVDFTHPGAYAWWRDSHRALFELGVDAFKTDFGEQVPDDAVAANGDTGKRLHNVYPLLYARCVWEATERFSRAGSMLWGRAGWAGSQRFPIGWGGDPQSDWGGFAASIRGGLSYQLSGAAYHASDIGGFYGTQPDAELYLRWLAQAVFSSHMRWHGIGEREPWAFGPEAEAIARRLVEFRYRLIPYIDTLAREAATSGLPTMRAMPLAFPDDRLGRDFDTQYMLGPALLVAPIVSPGGSVEVWLPAGDWVDLWSGEPLKGEQLVRRTEPLDRIPVFGRWGQALPLGPIVQHTGEIPAGRKIDEFWTFGPAGVGRRPA
jgi:alpha-D-xyloside xylohydrolase